MPAVTIICRHPLYIVTHAPAWPSCDLCQASFPHDEDCPGRGTPWCAEQCMGGVDPTLAALDALHAQPAHQRQP